MKKITFFLAILISMAATSMGQTPISILVARAQPVGTVVTIRGILLNDASKMGWTYYIQDETAGIAGYSTMFSANGVMPGDIVTVTGTLKDYNSLLEISPVTSVTIESSNNPLPAPAVLAVPDISEDYEAMLVKVNNIHFDPTVQGTLFNGGTSGANYNVYDQDGNTFQVRILPLTDLQSTLIPMGNVNITGCLGQYSPSNPITGYQLIPRSLGDIVSNSSISLTTPVTASNITTSSVTLNWTTDNPGSSFVKYGPTSALGSGIITGTANTTDHSVTIPGSAAQIFYAKAFSISATAATDTAKSSIGAYVTASNSSGNIKVYFNTPVDNSVSTGTNAISIGQAVSDTLVNYINRAKQTIDIAIYSFNSDGLANFTAALNAAANRGVNIRIVYCGTTSNPSIANLNSSVHVLQGPGANNPAHLTRDGIMHDKFMIIDANSTDAYDPLVWTGSFNWTSDNMNTDANNLIIIQDQALARTYQVEFEEMWGSNTLTPNFANAKFGSAKTNNTPHQLNVGDQPMECYFSPSDNVNVEIINRISSAETDLEIASMLVTRKEMAYAISDVAAAGVNAQVLVSSFSDEVVPANPPTYPNADSTVFNTLKHACSAFGDYNGGGVMHNKYMIVDQSNTGSDPLVWTGSHNWSAGANNFNDENSIVVHNATIANIYYQNIVKLFTTADVLYAINDPSGYAKDDVTIYPNPATSVVNIDVKATQRTSYTVQLMDMTGRKVLENSNTDGIGVNHTSLDVSGLNQGIYFLRISSKTGSYVQKLVIR
jgi:phosphatidylserine/phosphatidylglycerophosphate/cardiolipin synthase-like enzyme